jgi:hypothetical protein
METALMPGILIRPGDIYVPVGDGGMAVVYDVNWSRLLWNRPYLHPSILAAFAADTAERRKAVHYANNCASQGIHFTPLAQETLGGCFFPGGKDTQARSIPLNHFVNGEPQSAVAAIGQ